MTRYKLVDIPWVEKEWQTAHKVKALALNGRCEVNKELVSWKKDSNSDFTNILETLKYIAEQDRYRHPKRTRSCKRYGELFEIKKPGGGHARLFCFPFSGTKDPMIIIVACGSYWKTKDDRKLQNAAMKRAHKHMLDFLALFK